MLLKKGDKVRLIKETGETTSLKIRLGEIKILVEDEFNMYEDNYVRILCNCCPCPIPTRVKKSLFKLVLDFNNIVKRICLGEHIEKEELAVLNLT